MTSQIVRCHPPGRCPRPSSSPSWTGPATFVRTTSPEIFRQIRSSRIRIFRRSSFRIRRNRFCRRRFRSTRRRRSSFQSLPLPLKPWRHRLEPLGSSAVTFYLFLTYHFGWRRQQSLLGSDPHQHDLWATRNPEVTSWLKIVKVNWMLFSLCKC